MLIQTLEIRIEIILLSKIEQKSNARTMTKKVIISQNASSKSKINCK